MKHFLQQFSWMLMAFLLLSLPLSAAEYAKVTPENSKVTKVDAGEGKLSRVTLTVTLKEGQQPNGQAQLRLATDETSPVEGETTILADRMLEQSRENPLEWSVRWLGVKPGKYKVYFQQKGGDNHTLLHEVEIMREAPPAPSVPLKIASMVVKHISCQATTGAVTIHIEGGKAPFTYRATVKHSNGAQSIKEYKGNDRSWTVEGLAAGESAFIAVTDANGSKVSKQSDAIDSPEVEYYRDGSNIFVIRTGKDSFDYYKSLKIFCDNKDMLNQAIERVAKTIKIQRRDNNEWVPLEYAPRFTKTFWDGYCRVFFKVPIGEGKGQLPLPAYGTDHKIQYEDICGRQLGSNDGFYLHGATLKDMFYYTAGAFGTPTEDCGWKDVKYVFKYHFANDRNRTGTKAYYFMDETHRYASIYKQNADGTWPDKPLMDKVEMWTNPFDRIESGQTAAPTSVELPGKGVYKFVYNTGNPSTDFEQEFAIGDPLPGVEGAINKGSNQFATKGLGIHGNTGGIVFKPVNMVAPFQVIVKRPDGKKEFDVTDFCDDHVYKKTINFPQTIDFTTERHHYSIGDLPEGKYTLEVYDQCGRKNTLEVEITKNELMTYNLKRDHGFSEGVYTEYSCDNQSNAVQFDFGVTRDKNYIVRQTLGYGYVTKKTSFFMTRPTFTYQTDKPADLQDDVYFSVSYAPILNLGEAIVSREQVYSAIKRELRTYDYAESMNLHAYKEGEKWTPRDTPDPYWAKTFHFAFNESSANAFDVVGGLCDNSNPKPGVIVSSLQAGKSVSMPVGFELYEADDNGNPKGEAIQKKEARTKEEAYVVWKGLEKKVYAVKIVYGNGGACNMKKVVDLINSGLPQPVYATPEGDKIQDHIDIDITDGMSPMKVYIPISPYIYDAEWYDISGEKNELKQKGNNIYVTFDKPGVYTYEIRTMYTDKTGCPGSSGGTRLVKFNVTKREVKNYWMGSADADNGTNFSIASNWTANRVPAHGEDVIFATRANNNGKGAVNDCRLTSAGKMALNFTAAKLENQSDKAMIIPQGSALHVTTAAIGFEHQKGGDGKYSPVRLKIEAGTNGRPNGTFVARYDGVEKDRVYAEVMMNVQAKQVEQSWTDDLQGSPTKGHTFKVKSTTQFFGIPFMTMSAKQYALSGIYAYDEAHNAEKALFQKFVPVKKGETMTAFKGYAIERKETKVLPLRGYLNFGDATLTLTRRASKVVGAAGEESFVRWGLGQNLFGNSYTAPIKISSLNAALGNDVDKTVYIYNTGSAVDWTSTLNNTASVGAAGSYTAVPVKLAEQMHYNEIPSMQGFLLKYNKDKTSFDATATGEVKLSYKDHVMTTASISQKAKGAAMADSHAAGMVHLKLLNDGRFVDEMWLFETDEATDGFDNGYDGEKLGGELLKTSICSKTRAGMYQVNATNDLTKANITVKVSRPGTYTITASRSNLPQYEDLKMVDYQARMVVPFDGDTLTYRFVTDGKMINPNRFVLMNTRATKLEDIINGVEPTLESLSGDYLVYDLSGVQVKAIRLPEQKAGLKKNLVPGVYIVTKKDGTDKAGTKIMVTE